MNAEQKAEALRLASDFREWAQDAKDHNRQFVPIHYNTLFEAAALLRALAAETAPDALDKARAEERERCAKVCEEDEFSSPLDCADVIRKGEK